MSVLIKGMEMSDGCNTCQLRDLRFNYYVCRAKKLEDGFYLDVDDVVGRRHRYCPLVEIPTPHGRLIDAEELSKVFDWKQLENSPDEKEQTLYSLGQTTIEAIREAPTIIEAEVSE